MSVTHIDTNTQTHLRLDSQMSRNSMSIFTTQISIHTKTHVGTYKYICMYAIYIVFINAETNVIIQINEKENYYYILCVINIYIYDVTCVYICIYIDRCLAMCQKENANASP